MGPSLAMARRLLLLLLSPVGAGRPRFNASEAKLSCDAMLEHAFPDLCEMEVTQHNLTVRNLTLAYWRYRGLNAGAAGSGKLPVLMVHGGPGMNHNYILPLKQQACRGREVVFYDQVGTGASSTPEDVRNTAPWLFDLDYYPEEVKALLDDLGWSRFHILGNSWGTVVCQKFAFLQDPRLVSVVLSGPLSDSQLYGQSQWNKDVGNLATLPHFVQDVLHTLEADVAYDSALYEAIAGTLTSFFTTRVIPTPDCFLAALPTLRNSSNEIYVGIQGASEFTMHGVMEFMNLTAQLPTVSKPVLLTYGEFDTMRPPVIETMYRSLPRVWRARLPRCGHCTMIDAPRLMNDIVGDFLDHVESGSLGSFQVPPEAFVPEPSFEAMMPGPVLGGSAGPARVGAAAGPPALGAASMPPGWLPVVLVATSLISAVLGASMATWLSRRSIMEASHAEKRQALLESSHF